MDKNYIVLQHAPNGPTIDLLRGGPGTRMLAKLADQQQPGLPPGLVVVEIPANCYLDTNDEVPPVTLRLREPEVFGTYKGEPVTAERLLEAVRARPVTTEVHGVLLTAVEHFLAHHWRR